MTDTVATAEMIIFAYRNLTFAVSSRSHREVGIAVAQITPIMFPAQTFCHHLILTDFAGLHLSNLLAQYVGDN
jgi:hypothetical protein